MGSVAEAIGRTPADRVKAAPPVVCWFEDCGKESVPLVGGKCASLGELINAGVRVPPGFALTTEGYRRFIAEAGIDQEIQLLLREVDTQDLDALERASGWIREAIEAQPFSIEMEDLIAESYRKLAVRCCMPAVVGTGHATKIIKTGMMLRVDGSTGAVTIAR